MLVGYSRISTSGQDLSLQKEALAKAGCKRIYEDIASGSRESREGLNKALETMREGDTLIVWRLDRLARSLKQLIDIVSHLNAERIGLRSLQESIDTTTSGGKLIFHVFGALAEFEREVISERTKAGLASARSRGRQGGRPAKMNRRKLALAQKLIHDPSIPISDICRTLDISRSTLYRHLTKAENTK